MLLLVGLFLAGVLEDFVSSWHVKAISRGHAFLSGMLDFAYVIIWYAVLVSIVSNISNLWLAVSYAAGSGVGSYAYVRWQKEKDGTPKLDK